MTFRRSAHYALFVVTLGGLADPAIGQTGSSAHLVPFFPAASELSPQGFLRIVNHSNVDGTVIIVATDDAGNESGELTLALGARETANLDAAALESGAPELGLTGSTGRGHGDWRLRLTTDLDIETQAYVRYRGGAAGERLDTSGVLAEMFATAPRADGAYRVDIFNPASNLNQVSRLRMVNVERAAVAVTIRGTDDSGAVPGSGVTVELLPGEVRTFTSQETGDRCRFRARRKAWRRAREMASRRGVHRHGSSDEPAVWSGRTLDESVHGTGSADGRDPSGSAISAAWGCAGPPGLRTRYQSLRCGRGGAHRGLRQWNSGLRSADPDR